MNDGTRRKIRWLPLVLGLVAIGFTAVRGCQEGPFGRNQVVALNAEQEARLGMQAFQEVLSTADVVRSGPLVDVVHEVTARLAAATKDEEFLRRTQQDYQRFEWQVRVVRSGEVNAFCLPGGKMVVYTAILPVAETDAGLATVMGHEICHALAHHGAERMAHQQMAQIGVLSAGASLGDVEPQQRQQVMMALNAGAKFGILRYSRKHETEADHMGLLLMAVAGYDPRESTRFWERMARTSKGGGPPEFLSTHPSHERRISDLKAWMAEALPLYEKSSSQSEPRPLPVTALARGRFGN
jgi:predicted Zn-dependent protease